MSRPPEEVWEFAYELKKDMEQDDSLNGLGLEWSVRRPIAYGMWGLVPHKTPSLPFPTIEIVELDLARRVCKELYG